MKTSGTQLRSDFSLNNRAWVPSQLFFPWLTKFDSRAPNTRGRQVVLLFDCCDAHGMTEAALTLKQAEIVFFSRAQIQKFNFANQVYLP